MTGKNVDIIIQDNGTLAAHPEFLDGSGKSRVRDVVLDGPYYIDQSYFTSNSLTFTRPDGRVGIATTARLLMRGGKTHQKDQEHTHHTEQ
ncbi:MAG: hypothetical protein CM15mL4_0970 [uncultured marine virus]|nr:MAG: hypothetical protein CM15mL4_0970 [uncultured marine virus]